MTYIPITAFLISIIYFSPSFAAIGVGDQKVVCTDELLSRAPFPGLSSMPEPKTFSFKLSDGQTIFVEESGNPHGKPVIVIHGGPFGCRPSNHRHLFDPTRYRVIYFDQRGANKSRDSQFLEKGNYLKLLGSDMEEIRSHYKADAQSSRQCQQIRGKQRLKPTRLLSAEQKKQHYAADIVSLLDLP